LALIADITTPSIKDSSDAGSSRLGVAALTQAAAIRQQIPNVMVRIFLIIASALSNSLIFSTNGMFQVDSSAATTLFVRPNRPFSMQRW
jgi:hypothetical protein